MNQITPEALEFVEEAKARFTENDDLSTYRNEKSSFIALRSGFRDDCMMVYELGNEVGNFVQQLPTQHKVLVDYDDISTLNELKTKVTNLYNEFTESGGEYGKGVTDSLSVVIKRLDKVKAVK